MSPPIPYNKLASLLSTLTTGEVLNQPGGIINSLNQAHLEPGVHTLQFQAQPTSGTNQVPLVEAVVSWKVGGQNLRRRISILDGTSITGVCEGVSVQLQDVTNVFYAIPQSPPESYNVMVTLCKGARPSQANPPVLYTSRSVQVPPGNSRVFPVPIDSGVMAYRVIGNLDTTEPDRSMVARCTGNAPTFFYYPILDNSWIPITPGARTVQVNNDGASDLTAGVIWAIEG